MFSRLNLIEKNILLLNYNMNTTIVSCMKGSAITTKDGRFTNVLPRGIEIKKGDKISVESVAIEFTGMEGDSIEIPQENKEGGKQYASNQCFMRLHPYIHHNNQNTLLYPHYYLAGSGGVLESSQQIYDDPTDEQNGYSAVFDAAVPTGAPQFMSAIGPGLALENQILSNSSNIGVQGMRFYLLEGNSEGHFPYQNNCDYQLMNTEVPIKVGLGFDSPSSIASQVTESLHAVHTTPSALVSAGITEDSAIVIMDDQSIDKRDIPRGYLGVNNATNQGLLKNVLGTGVWVSAHEEALSTSKSGVVKTILCNYQNDIDGTGRSGESSKYTDPTGPTGGWREIYDGGGNIIYASQNLAVGNIGLWTIGTKLLREGNTLTATDGELGTKLPFIDGTVDADLRWNKIYNMFDEETLLTLSAWNEGYVIVSNLEYNMTNLKYLARYLHSQKYYFNLGAEVPPSKTNELIKKKKYFQVSIPYGAIKDGGVYHPTMQEEVGGATIAKLGSPVDNDALAAGPTTGVFGMYSYMNAFYEKDQWALVIDSNQGASLLASTYKIDKDFGLGEYDNAEELAKALDIMVVPVREPNSANVYVGLVQRQKVPCEQGTEIKANNYMLIDMSFHQRLNPVVLPTNYVRRVKTEYDGSSNVVDSQPSDVVPPDTLAQVDGVNFPSLPTQQNLIQVGSPNAALSWDGDVGRFGFNNFSWANRQGELHSAATPTAGANTKIIRINDNGIWCEAMMKWRQGAATSLPNSEYPYRPIPITYALSGMGIGGIDNMLVEGGTAEKTTPETWKYNLFGSRLGFTWEQIHGGGYYNENNIIDGEKELISWGHSDAIYQPTSYNKNDFAVAEPTSFPTPLTTNAMMDSATAVGYSCNEKGVPDYKLGIEGGAPSLGINAISATALATNKPTKFDFPFWLCYSDIIGADFYGGEKKEILQTNNILAICNRAYITGDYSYSFATDYVFVATKDNVVTQITTDIQTPDYQSAMGLGDATTVLYKIQSPLVQFEVPQEAPQQAKGHTEHQGNPNSPKRQRQPK